ncbi:MAG: YcxB family protein [Lachnospiraceae bacterium]|nr:YcxB family protein [Lachnospiraceae bacterium]
MEGQKRSIADIAHMSTLSDDEAKELEREEGSEGYYDDDPLADYDEESGTGDPQDAENGGDDVSSAYPKKAEKPRMQHTDPMYKVTAKPEAKDMFDFMLYHTYHNVAGIASVLIGIGAIVALIFNIINKGETMVAVLLAVIVVMFLANSPLTIWYRAKKQAELIADSSNTITYTFSGVGLDMSRGKEYASYEWSRLEKIIEVQKCYYFYLSKNSAFVIPKEDLLGNEAGFKRILQGSGVKTLKLLPDEA